MQTSAMAVRVFALLGGVQSQVPTKGVGAFPYWRSRGVWFLILEGSVPLDELACWKNVWRFPKSDTLSTSPEMDTGPHWMSSSKTFPLAFMIGGRVAVFFGPGTQTCPINQQDHFGRGLTLPMTNVPLGVPCWLVNHFSSPSAMQKQHGSLFVSRKATPPRGVSTESC